MEQSDFDSITTRVRHLRENITELQKNYDQLTLNAKVSGNVQQADLDIVQTSIHGVGYAQRHRTREGRLCYTSPSPKEKGQLAEPSQGVPITESGQASSSSKLEETEHQASKPYVSGQPTTSGVKEGEISLRPKKGPKRVDTNNAGVKLFWFFNNTWESLLKGVEFDATHFITDVSGKYPRLWALKGAYPNTVNRWYKFGALASIRTVAPRFREILELPDWVCNAVQESWHNNPHIKRGDELEIKFITVASEDITNSIQYPSFHFMKLQRPDHRAANYIKTQETKPELLVNLTEDEVSTRRAWGVWACLT
ncbi:hypothetical protein ACS0TY_017933 [Phlomoides rotata]